MDTSEAVDLDSLIDLINEDDFENDSKTCEKLIDEQTSKHERENQPNVADLDSVISLICENATCDISAVDETPNHKREDKSNDDIAFLFPAAAEKADSPCTFQNTKHSLVHTGDTSSDDEKKYLNESGQQIKKRICSKSYHDRNDRKKQSSSTWKNRSNADSPSTEKPYSLDSLLGMRIVKPLISSDVMEKRMQGRKLIKMSFIKHFIKKGDIEGDWVTVGVVVRKIPPKTSKNGKIYSIWKLSDLHDTEKIISLFLFGAVHNEHWKTAVGTVVGFLNPTIMDANEKDDYLSIKLDHPGKMMLLGTSKDFGHCKSKRKDGTQCTMLVNLSQCQHCTYHVKSEYKKFSQRSEIQSSYSGRGISMRDKVLKGQNFFYAGQSFTPLGKQQKKSSTITSKDKLTLLNLGLKRKAAAVFNEEKAKSVKKVAEIYGDDFSKIAENNSEFINNRLTIPSAGSKNLLQHMMKSTAKEKNMLVLNRREMLKQHERQINSTNQSKRKDDATILKNLVPVLGKGLSPGQSVSLDFSSPNSKAAEHYAKLRAIQAIKKSGPIQKKNPNAVKSNPEPKRIKAALDISVQENSDEKTSEKKATLARSRLGCIDLNSEKIQKILNRKSSHAYEVEMAEMVREAAYFDRLEKKEMMEEKMISTKKIVCDVVSCKQCRYTANNAAERCKNENHPLKCHKAIKRFFECKDCKCRTECFTRFPLISCRNCGGSCFERTGMKRVRSGPKLDSELFKITEKEPLFLNQL